MTTKVVNIKYCKDYDIYCGRGGEFGNIFATTKPSKYSDVPIVTTKEEAIIAYLNGIINNKEYLLSIVNKCKDKTLGCFCVERSDKTPRLQCHVQIIAYIADNYPERCLFEEILNGSKNY